MTPMLGEGNGGLGGCLPPKGDLQSASSFRHAFVDACREVISEDGRHAFTGHSEGGVGRSYGTDVGKRRLCRVCLYVI
jgi:hypothetical protein